MVSIAGLHEVFTRNTSDIRSLFALRNTGEKSRAKERGGRAR